MYCAFTSFEVCIIYFRAAIHATMMNSLVTLSALAFTAFAPQIVLAFLPFPSSWTSRRPPSNLLSSSKTISPTKTEPMAWTKNEQAYGKFDQEDWGWVYTSVPPEASSSYMCQDIEGTIPSDLQGTYYKVGPGKFERQGERYAHVLDGDGFVAAFSISSQGVKYTGNFVKTEYFLEEEEKDEILFRNVFGTEPKGGPLKNALDLTLKNVANTNVVLWNNRLFALWEAGRPYELDPVTLETLDKEGDFDDAEECNPFDMLGNPDCAIRGVTIDNGGPIDKIMDVGAFFTAHPHVVDGDTLVGFVTKQDTSQNVCMDFYEFDAQWNIKQKSTYTFPNGCGAPHDFSVGKDYYAFFQNPLTLNNLPYVFGLKSPTQVMRMQLDQECILHLAPRTPGTKATQVKVPPYFTVHSVGRIEEDGSRVTIYTNGWDLKDKRYFPEGAKSAPFLGAWGGRYPDFEKFVPPSLLYRTTVDVDTEEVLCHEQVIPGLVVDFMTQDERNPHIQFMNLADMDGDSLPSTGYAKVDASTNEVEYWWAEPKIFTGELTPVAKRNGDAGSWVVGLLYDKEKERTSLAIFDSETFFQGPVARVHLPHHVSYGLHGFFANR